MAQRLEAEGSKNGKSEGSKNGPHKWDDQSDHDDVTKIYVRYSPKGIQSIRFDYVKSGIPNDGSLHGQSYHVNTQTFEINHLKNEHLESVEGYYTSSGIQALLFKTNLRISEQMGYPEGTKFTLAVAGKKIIGFHGSTDLSNILSLGAYFTWITSIKMEAKGGKGGREWDDGVDKAGFTKIHVRAGREGVQYIRFEYVDKDGNLKYGPIRGSTYDKGSTHVFEIKHVENEYLVSVEGYYDDASGVIQALQFKTNIKTSQLMGSQKGFKKFRLAADGMKIIGFFGFAEKNLNSLGPYFITLSATKLGCQGILEGKDVWDDGFFKGVRKVCVFCHCSNYITCLRINYDNDGKEEKRDHGVKDGHTGQEGEFVVDYPKEFITSVVGTFTPTNDRRVTSLTFKTSEKRTSKIFGDGSSSDSIEFVLKKKGCAIVGFHGWCNGFSLTALGAYFFPMPPRPTAEKIEAQGGDIGAPWDDGANFESVRKIYIGIGEIGISSVKFLYENDTNEMVVGDHHGNKTLLRHEEFELDYPSEYLTSVEGSYDVVPGSDEFEVIFMLKFKTNMRTSPRYGLDDDPSFVLRKEGHKIVGFHGKSNNMLHQIGVHVLPITHYEK